MRSSIVILALVIGFVSTKAQLITGQSGYPINNNIRQCPEFMILLNLDLGSAPVNYQVAKITFDVSYSCQFISNPRACDPDGYLPFVMYGQGTRYPNSSFAVGDTVEFNPLEARQRWWTFPNVVIDRPEQKITNITFLVGKGSAISHRGYFNFCQLYFRFLKENFKIGDVITIWINNVHVYQPGQSSYIKLPDFKIDVRLDNTTGVEEEALVDDLGPSQVYDIFGQLIAPYGQLESLPSGRYFIVTGSGLKRKIRPWLLIK
jgi:hypothetical protein